MPTSTLASGAKKGMLATAGEHNLATIAAQGGLVGATAAKSKPNSGYKRLAGVQADGLATVLRPEPVMANVGVRQVSQPV